MESVCEWPDKSNNYWIVQLELFSANSKVQALLFGRDYSETPGEILNRFISDLDTGVEYEVCGACRAAVLVERNYATFWGSGAEYGLGVDRAHLADVQKNHPEWTLNF